jgi:hypothetical protein
MTAATSPTSIKDFVTVHRPFVLGPALVVVGVFLSLLINHPHRIFLFVASEGLLLFAVSGYWRFQRFRATGMQDSTVEDAAQITRLRDFGELLLAAVIAVGVSVVAVAFLVWNSSAAYAALAFGIFGLLSANLLIPLMITLGRRKTT